ncbi:sulfotransferase [candidate division KSB1 bacterium]|nr:sulfotransferase [candidate division KSB1 bacterium]
MSCSGKEIKKPNLFVVGVPKSGTSSLHTYLGRHPEIFMSVKKELQFFGKDFWEESDAFHKGKVTFPYRNLKDYLNFFSSAQNEKIFGESTTKYLFSKVAANEIYKFNPNAKIIIILREPVDFLFSYHSQCLFDLVEDIADFEKALDMETERKKGVSIPPTTPVPSFAFYSEIVQFSEQIERFLQVFKQEQIKIIIFDDFKRNTLKVYKEILDFLEVDSNFVTDFNIVNPNKKITQNFLYFLFLSPKYFWIREVIRIMLPIKIRAFISQTLRMFFITHGKRDALDKDLKLRLKKKYLSEIIKLEKILKKSLIKLWNYDNL